VENQTHQDASHSKERHGEHVEIVYLFGGDFAILSIQCFLSNTRMTRNMCEKKGFTLILPILGLGHPTHKTIIVDNNCFCVGCHPIYFFFGKLQCRTCIN
jgi:hypothetical protein